LYIKILDKIWFCLYCLDIKQLLVIN
jgi:hypothetical protein